MLVSKSEEQPKIQVHISSFLKKCCIIIARMLYEWSDILIGFTNSSVKSITAIVTYTELMPMHDGVAMNNDTNVHFSYSNSIKRRLA